jgi:hypothetical protein
VKHAALILAATAATVTPTSTFSKGPISPSASHEIVRLDTIASTLAGKRTSVNCWSRRDWTALQRNAVRHGMPRLADAEAFTNGYVHQIQISPDTCETLAKLLAHRHVGELDAVTAIEVVAHEAQHAAGVRAEHSAECGAIRTLPRAARLFGYSTQESQRTQHVFRGTLYPLDAPAYRTPVCPAGLPGIVVPNEFGPDAAVAKLRTQLHAIGATQRGWRSYPVPPSPLSHCSIVHDRSVEVARVEEIYASPDEHAGVDVIGVEFHTVAETKLVLSRSKSSFACFAAAGRRRLRRIDPHASVVVSPLPRALHAAGLRVTTRTKTLPGETLLVQDTIVLGDPRSRVLFALRFSTSNRAPALAAELRAVAAARR